MLTEVRGDNDGTPTVTPEPAAGRPAWWARLLARVPLAALYGVASVLGWLTFRFFPHRQHVVRENLTKAFPAFDEPQLREVMRRYYLGFAQMLMEIVKSVRMPAHELRRRVRILNLEAPRALLAQGHSVLLVAAHQCNWEWMLLSLSTELGYPVDAAYKPLVNDWAEREMKKVRTRFGSRLVPAKDLLPDILKRRGVVRAVAMVADQEPTTSEHKYWTHFLAGGRLLVRHHGYGTHHAAPWWRTRSRPPASTSTGHISSVATRPSTWDPRRSHGSRASRCSSSPCAASHAAITRW